MIEFQRFEFWGKRGLNGERKMLGSYATLDLAKRTADAWYDYAKDGEEFLLAEIAYIELNFKGRVEHSWVKSQDDGRWIQLG